MRSKKPVIGLPKTNVYLILEIFQIKNILEGRKKM